MRAMIKIVPAVGLAVSAVALSALPAGAATPATARFTASVAFSSAAPAVLPNSTLRASKTVSGKVSYSPNHLTAGWSGTTNPGNCPSNLVMATITNKSKATQGITYKKSEILVSNKAFVGLCFYGTGTHVL